MSYLIDRRIDKTKKIIDERCTDPFVLNHIILENQLVIMEKIKEIYDKLPYKPSGRLGPS